MNTRTLLLAGAVSAIAAATPGWAADLVQKAPAFAPVAAVNWTGLYLGGHLGYGQGPARISDPVAPGPGLDTQLKGALGGGQIGFNYQTGAMVFGVEADISASDIDGTSTFIDPTGDVSTFNTQVRWTALVTGRIGYAMDRALLYVKGGVAFGGFRVNAANITDATAGSARFNRTGWTLGGGLEYALSGPWSLRGEYDYLNFPTRNFSMTDATGAVAAGALRQHLHQFKLGLNYRF